MVLTIVSAAGLGAGGGHQCVGAVQQEPELHGLHQVGVVDRPLVLDAQGLVAVAKVGERLLRTCQALLRTHDERLVEQRASPGTAAPSGLREGIGTILAPRSAAVSVRCWPGVGAIKPRLMSAKKASPKM
jgi:hypothetical protein